MQDVFRLYAFALVIQVCIFIVYITLGRPFKPSSGTLIRRLLDMGVHAAPPGLPACWLVAGAASRRRLAKQGIKLVFPEVLQKGACADIVCFDKTGTLTGSMVSSSSFPLHAPFDCKG